MLIENVLHFLPFSSDNFKNGYFTYTLCRLTKPEMCCLGFYLRSKIKVYIVVRFE